MTTLAYGAISIALPDDMLWIDEFSNDWKPIAQKRDYSIGGVLVTESTAKIGGRPITLQAGDSWGWCTRDVVAALRAAELIAGQTFTLTLRGIAYTVAMDHEAGALEATQVVDYSTPVPTDYYVVTLRFFIKA